jgi:hypothetical protein
VNRVGGKAEKKRKKGRKEERKKERKGVGTQGEG